ncbi:MAG: hypothetical protein ACKO3Q_04865 [Betaproteobacteria bacterium]
MTLPPIMAIPFPHQSPKPLSEHAADAATEQILAHLCRCCGTTLPALIFRHLATREGLMGAFWKHLGGLFEGGQLQAVAWHLMEAIDTDGLITSALPALEAPTLARARSTLEQYGRSNPVNLLALLTLLHQVREGAGPAGPVTDRPEPWQAPPPPSAAMLPMVDVAAIDTGTRWLLNDLRSGDRRTLDAVVPSLYRHFVPYPALLQAVHRSLAPRFADGQIAARAQALQDRLQPAAAALAARLGPVPEVLRQADVLATMQDFAQRVIPPMIIVGRALHRALSDDRSARP